MKLLLTIYFFIAVWTSAGSGFVRGRNLDGGLYFKTVGVGDNRITMLALPSAYSWAFSPELSLDAVAAPAFALSSLEESSVFRLAGTKVRAAYNYKDMALGTFGIKIPTGLNQFSSSQIVTVGNASTRQLNIRYADLFNALDISAGVASSIPFENIGPGDLSLGLGLSTLFKGAYQPLEEADLKYNPANEFNIALAGEYVFIAADRQITALLDLGFTIYGKSEGTGGEEINPGNKFNWALSGNTKLLPEIPVNVRLANYRIGAPEVEKVGETGKAASDLVFSVKAGLPVLPDYSSYGTLTLAGYEGGGALSYGDAFIFGIGGGGSMRLNENMFARAGLGLDFGSLEDDGIFGLRIDGGVSYRF
ncbi:MAG: hypothetical protein ACLFQK_05540 [Fibrobacterota bacterium]